MCCGYHVDFVRLSFGTLLFKELIYRFVFRLPLKVYSYYLKQSLSQSRRASLRYAS